MTNLRADDEAAATLRLPLMRHRPAAPVRSRIPRFS